MNIADIVLATDEFCAAVNASAGMDLRTRFEAVRNVYLPEGFDSVVVRFAGTGEFAGCWSSPSGSGNQLAFRIAGWLAFGGRSPLRQAAFHEPEQRTINLVLIDDREAPLSTCLARP